MKYTYIGIDGNIKQTEDIVLLPTYLEKIDNTYFEKKDIVIEKIKEVKEDVSNELDDELLEKAKEYCKENKVRGYGLLKGQKLLDIATNNGFKL